MEIKNSDTPKIVGMSDISIETNVRYRLVFKDVSHVLDLCLNLISVRKLDEKSYNNHLGNE